MDRMFVVFIFLMICITGIAGAQENEEQADNFGGVPATELMGWGTLALINAGLAQIKNKLSESEGLGGFGWFIITLLIGPLATLFIVMFKD